MPEAQNIFPEKNFETKLNVFIKTPRERWLWRALPDESQTPKSTNVCGFYIFIVDHIFLSLSSPQLASHTEKGQGSTEGQYVYIYISKIYFQT